MIINNILHYILLWIIMLIGYFLWYFIWCGFQSKKDFIFYVILISIFYIIGVFCL
jgi:hypothetical protein